MCNVTQGQKNIIKFIQDILEIKFCGNTYNDADKFIKQYKKQAESNYRHYNYKNAPKEPICEMGIYYDYDDYYILQEDECF